MKFAVIPMALVMMASTGAFAAPNDRPPQAPPRQERHHVKPHEHRYRKDNRCRICGAERPRPAPKPAPHREPDRRP